MLDEYERLHWSCIGPICQYGTNVGHQGLDQWEQPEMGSPNAYKSIMAVSGPNAARNEQETDALNKESIKNVIKKFMRHISRTNIQVVAERVLWGLRTRKNQPEVISVGCGVVAIDPVVPGVHMSTKEYH